MLKNPTGRKIRCPECFAKDEEYLLNYDEDKNEYYCCRYCFTGSIERVNEMLKLYIKNKYTKR